MGNYIIKEEDMQALADAIMKKTGQNSITGSGMAQAIENMEGSPSDVFNTANNTLVDLDLTGTTSLQEYAFYNNAKIRSVKIPDVTVIPDYCFYNCTNLETIVVGRSLATINTHGICNNPKLKTIVTSEKLSGGNSYYDNWNVSTIRQCGLYNNTLLESIPSTFNNAVSVARYAMANNTSLEGDLIFNGAITTSENTYGINETFQNLTSLNSITFNADFGNNTVGSMFTGTRAALYFHSDTNLNMSSTGGNTVSNYRPLYGWLGSEFKFGDLPVNTVASNTCWGTFYNCTGLTHIAFADSVTAISTKSSAFYGCTSLASVTIPDSVTSIGSDAFQGCISLASVTIPDSVTSIGEYAFKDCTSLTSVTIPDSVTSIGSYAFQGCISLTSVTIADSVTSIGSYAFRDCTSLTSVTIPDLVTSIGEYVFHGCTSLASVTIPDSVTSIGSSAFRDCTSLTSVTIPDSVTSIGSYAFYNSGLTSIVIPESVVSVGNRAFEQCCNMTAITCHCAIDNILSRFYRPYNQDVCGTLKILKYVALTNPDTTYIIATRNGTSSSDGQFAHPFYWQGSSYTNFSTANDWELIVPSTPTDSNPTDTNITAKYDSNGNVVRYTLTTDYNGLWHAVVDGVSYNGAIRRWKDIITDHYNDTIKLTNRSNYCTVGNNIMDTNASYVLWNVTHNYAVRSNEFISLGCTYELRNLDGTSISN